MLVINLNLYNMMDKYFIKFLYYKIFNNDSKKIKKFKQKLHFYYIEKHN